MLIYVEITCIQKSIIQKNYFLHYLPCLLSFTAFYLIGRYNSIIGSNAYQNNNIGKAVLASNNNINKSNIENKSQGLSFSPIHFSTKIYL
jgi:hypothetical protein